MFGNACSLFNPNASRLGKYTELQFTERGHQCDIKTLDYYLETNRAHPLRQRSTGARPNAIRANDAHRFEQLKVALKTIGLSK
ncbi:hypothetical protein PISMIDRAFT_20250 [Pisolithus microcarpus 441]|uniref:Myosin motor domain-containing protein n=1 Tax=Pisolithus microcarpus 441 TaxID=765257 RepID=A0A0C9XE79_9AGAM|nr:hypothetical protein PISMIDRAFT_20250 [Pisolithus microcarpus 441]